ncbi:unnamed protein product [Caenorhabditis angaria]|uniref:Uncharacterized protein n=1 Tax=Caenorhabditis angaria TaxID=860376 RepID=A0A9P1IR61_9PELO|nr:unnamed protein product [Caenorhabditis angaria]
MKRIFLIFWTLFLGVNSIAKFQVATVTDSSLVIKMVEAANVTSFDITVNIFDLAKQNLFRKTQLEHVTNDQLLAFDGLKPDTWFAIRIEYRLNFMDNSEITKQEMVIKTKKSTREDPKNIEQMVAHIDDLFVSKDSIYIGVASVFKEIKKISTVIVPELRCENRILNPVSQQIIQHVSFHFDLSKLPKDERKCNMICMFPYLRVLIIDNGVTETFRAQEWCGSVEEARHLLIKSSNLQFSSLIISILLSLSILV